MRKPTQKYTDTHGGTVEKAAEARELRLFTRNADLAEKQTERAALNGYGSPPSTSYPLPPPENPLWRTPSGGPPLGALEPHIILPTQVRTALARRDGPGVLAPHLG